MTSSKNYVPTTPILAYANFGKPFKLHTDVSVSGLGVVSITDQFHEYLYGNTFDAYTDNNPLTYVLTTATLDAKGHRWIAGLANYNFHIHYKSGKSNLEADALSQIHWEKCDKTSQDNSI